MVKAEAIPFTTPQTLDVKTEVSRVTPNNVTDVSTTNDVGAATEKKGMSKKTIWIGVCVLGLLIIGFAYYRDNQKKNEEEPKQKP
jgi:hypothetical protein